MTNQLPLQTRHIMLCNTPNYIVSGGSYNHALNSNGGLVSPEITMHPTASGIQQFMILRVYGSVINNGTANVTLTPFGVANLIQRVEYTDTAGYIRHAGVSGRALELMAYARQYDVVGGAFVEDPQYGVGLQSGTSDYVSNLTVPPSGTSEFSHTFIIPFAYGANDQRGAVPALLQQGQQTLKIKFADLLELAVPTVANPLKAVFQQSSAGTLDLEYQSLACELFTVTKNRNLPTQLPLEMFADTYQLYELAYNVTSAGTDQLIPLEAGRTHYNAFLVYDNGGTLNTETDVHSLSVLFAGSQDALRMSSRVHNMMARNYLRSGLPPATYYFNFRADPMETSSKGGSIDLVLNPASVNTGATLYAIGDYVTRGSVISYVA